ncbi:MAG: Flp pilus assembly complex ATPase component TadA [Desulfobacterales bacterium]|nr:Flp pilus assembly complex ATPase component TadA [Desulfobacterales bacterium]
MQIQPAKKKRFGDILVEGGLITVDQLQQALAFGRERQIKLGEALRELGFATEETVAKTVAKQLHIPFIDFNRIILDPEVIRLVPEMIARKHKMLAVGKRPGETLVAFADPLNIFALDDASRYIKDHIVTCVAEESKIIAAIDRYHGNTAQPMPPQASKATRAAAKEFDAVQAVDRIILQAVRSRASDIHIEPTPKKVRTRIRVDGILRESLSFPLESHPSIVSRIKILARMDIGEKRKPLDGRFEIPVSGRSFDIRVSTLPLQAGEKVVMRLLDKAKVRISLQDLGFEPEQQDIFEKHLLHPHEILLVTGPTGSGKTTTLYGALNYINSPEKNIVTVEDPLEYELPGINQIQVNPKADLTFASALRSILRQDPDVIMIGEVRDLETAEIAIQAALTGHLVLSTLHTNDAVGAVARLIDMEIPPFLISSSLGLVVAQRLVRLLCPLCRHSFSPPAALQEELNIPVQEDRVFYQPGSCKECDESGYRGRMAIYEIMPIGNAIKDLIVTKSASHEIAMMAAAEGVVPLRRAGLKKVFAGLTSLDEVLRVTLEAQE